MALLRKRAIAIVTAIFAITATILVLESPVGVHWSADCSAKYLAVLSLRYDGAVHYDVPYAGEHFDPELHAIPLGESYYDIRDGEIHISWPELFPILTWPFYAILGWYGLFVLPVTCGALAVYLAGRCAEKIRAGTGWIASALTGFATPVLVYATLFWEHTPALALMLGATLLALQFLEDETWWKLAAGAGCVGLAAAGFRTDANLFFASWVGALFLILRGNRRLLAIPVSVTGFVIGASPASALNWITNGKILAANTTKNTPPPSLAYLLHAKWATLPHFFGGTTVPARDSWIMIGGACAIAAASYFLKARARAAVVVVSALAMTYANRHALHAILSVYPFDAHGWLVMSPVLALGFLLSPSIVDEPRKRARLFILFLAAFICVVSFAALVAAYPNGWAADGNHEWGPRYWLILFPILAISAAVNWDATFFRADRAQHAFLGASIAAILTVSVAFEIRGLDSIRFCERDVDANRIVLESRDDTPLVTDIFMMSSLAPDLFFSRPSFYFRYGDRARFERWFPMAAARGLTTFDFATFEDLTSHPFFSQPIDGYTFELGEVSRHVRLRVVRVRAIRR